MNAVVMRPCEELESVFLTKRSPAEPYCPNEIPLDLTGHARLDARTTAQSIEVPWDSTGASTRNTLSWGGLEKVHVWVPTRH